jgi:ankyrin repeat protein
MPIVLHEDTTLRYLLPYFNKDELNEGLTPAVIDDRGATVRDLIQRGAAVNHLDKFGMAALHYAASMDHGDTQMVELLLLSGADTKLRTKDGLTALALAKKYGHADIQQVLERAGGVE